MVETFVDAASSMVNRGGASGGVEEEDNEEVEKRTNNKKVKGKPETDECSDRDELVARRQACEIGLVIRRGKIVVYTNQEKGPSVGEQKSTHERQKDPVRPPSEAVPSNFQGGAIRTVSHDAPPTATAVADNSHI